MLCDVYQEATVLDVAWSGQLVSEYCLRSPPEEDAILLQVAYSDICHLLAAGTTDGNMSDSETL
jgi:hypothetical protein